MLPLTPVKKRRGCPFWTEKKTQEEEAAEHRSLELPSELLGYSRCRRRGCSRCRHGSSEHTDRDGSCESPRRGGESRAPPAHLPPTPHGPEEEPVLLELSTVPCHHQKLPAGARGQHPQTNTLLGQCQIIHLHIRRKILAIIYAPLHHLICKDLSWPWCQIREKGSLHTRFPRLCAQTREKSTQGRQGSGTLHRKCKRNEKLKWDAKQKNKPAQLLLLAGFIEIPGLSCFQALEYSLLPKAGASSYLFVFK